MYLRSYANMFKWCLALFALAICLLVMFVFCSSEADVSAYRKLVESSDPTRSADILTFSEQKRQHVRKEIWYRGDEPLYFFIESADSELFFFQQENQIEVVEQLGKVHAIMQEELYYVLDDGREATKEENGKYLIKGSNPQKAESWLSSAANLTPMQIVRYFEAEKACYNYNTQLFLAQNVFLKKYKMKGHDKVLSFANESPLMSGKAQSIEFLIKGKKLDFQAHKLEARFNPKEEAL